MKHCVNLIAGVHQTLNSPSTWQAWRDTPRRHFKSRRGSVMALMAFVLPILAVLAAFCINSAQMQLTRTELIVATDAAAKAGGRAFSEMQTVEAAKTAAVTTAALNTVNGEPLRLNSNDGSNEMEFGTTVQHDGLESRYHFQKLPTSQVASGAVIASAFRVNGRRNSSSISGRVPLIIPGMLEMDDFAAIQESVAMQVDRDISLVLDRSGSMEEHPGFDWPYGTSPWTYSALSAGEDAGILYYSYRRGAYRPRSGESWDSYQEWAWEEHFELGPAPQTPWRDLVDAVDAFLDVLDVTSQEEQVSVSSYSTEATLDSYLEKDLDVTRDTVEDLDTGGWTAIGRGMREGIETLLDSAARPYAAKTMVVMTDGIHNRDESPVSVATDLLSSYNLTIHTVTFGEGADQELMQQVAGIGGGKHYHAATGAELVAIFEEIANNLPTILVE